MSRERKRKKKWKKEEVKKKILAYLAKLPESEAEKATKYKIKEDLGIPLSTVLNAVSELEKELLEHEVGRRGSHISRLTLKGLIYCVKNQIIDLKRAKDIFLKLLEHHGLSYEEIVKGLSIPEKGHTISEKALSCYIKQYLRFLQSYPLDDVRLEEIVKEFREEVPAIYGYSFKKNFGGVITWCIRDVISRSGSSGKHVIIPSPTRFTLFFGCSKDETDELLKFVARTDDSMRTFLVDGFESLLSSIIGKPWRVRKWMAIGSLTMCIELNIDAYKLVN